MIRVTVELISAVDQRRSRVLGVAEIANIGGDAQTGSYDARLLKWGEGRRTWKRGLVKGFPRERLGPWDLLYRALAEIVGGRNRKASPPEDGAIPFGETPVEELEAELSHQAAPGPPI